MAKVKKSGFIASYNFVDKDPIIDVARTAGQLSKKTYKQIREAGGPPISTQYAWFDGRVRQPRFCKVMQYLRALGGDMVILLPNGQTAHILSGGEKPLPSKGAFKRV